MTARHMLTSDVLCGHARPLRGSQAVHRSEQRLARRVLAGTPGPPPPAGSAQPGGGQAGLRTPRSRPGRSPSIGPVSGGTFPKTAAASIALGARVQPRPLAGGWAGAGLSGLGKVSQDKGHTQCLSPGCSRSRLDKNTFLLTSERKRGETSVLERIGDRRLPHAPHWGPSPQEPEALC